MADDLSKDFDKENDLSKQFEAERQNPGLPQAPPDQSSMTALRRAVLQGALFGWEDRAMAGAKTGLQNLGLQEGPGDYEKNLEAVRAKNAASEEAHPTLTTAGKIAGGVLGATVGGEALEAAGAPSVLQLGGNTLGQSVKTGAMLGASQGLGETQDLTKSALEDVKNTVRGAEVGAGTAGVLHGIFSGIPAGVRRLGKTKMVESMGKAYDTGEAGTDVVGSQATTDLTKNAKDTVMDQFIPKIKQLQKDLMGEFDPVTRQRTPGAYDNLYEEANQKMPQGVDVPGLINRVQQYKNTIENSPTLKAFYKPQLEDINNILADLNSKVGKPTLMNSEAGLNAPEGLFAENTTRSNATPMSVSDLGAEINNLQDVYDTNPESNKYALDLKKIYDAHLDDALEDAGLSDKKDALDQSYKQLQDIKERFGISNRMTAPEVEDTAKGIVNKFEKAANSDPNAINDLVPSIDKLLNLDPESSDMVKSLADNARDLSVSKAINKESPLSQGVGKAHLSGSAITSNVGYAAGKVAGSLKSSRAFKLAQNLVNGMGKGLDEGDSQAIGEISNAMMNSSDASTKQMGNLFNNVVNEADPNRRRALMFSLGQQPAFRHAVGNVIRGMPGVPDKDEFNE